MKPTRRHFAAALATTTMPALAHDDDGDPAIDRTYFIHGRTSPLAVAGYRIGDAALKKLKLTRAHASLEVVQYAPASAAHCAIVDGLQAATGASLGNLNLKLVASAAMYSVVRNKQSGQELKVELLPEFLKTMLETPAKNLLATAEKVGRMPEAQIFRSKA